VDDLQLPPSFVIDHAVRTLSFQGAMAPSEMARHWRVADGVAVDVAQRLKATGLVEVVSGQTTFETSGRFQLTKAGEARVAVARERTWYAGPLPVPLRAFEKQFALASDIGVDPEKLHVNLTTLGIDPSASAEVGQAVAGGTTLAFTGLAHDEMAPVTAAIGSSLLGDVTLPYALFAAGSVLRVFDSRYHYARRAESSAANLDILRSHSEEPDRWVRSAPPLVMLSGGVTEADVVAAYDSDAHLYIAPPPFAAAGGVFAVLDADAHNAGLKQLARSWLMPGRYQTGVIRLRSGERIDVPWRAAVVLFGSHAGLLSSMPEAVAYRVDLSRYDGASLQAALSWRLQDRAVFDDAMIATVAEALQRRKLTARRTVANFASYLRNRQAFEGLSFVVTNDVLNRALDAVAGVASEWREEAAA
jgi:hypothetical protein